MSYHANALCQAALLEGMSKKYESQLENRVRHFVSHNGPEFAIRVLKQLREHAMDNLDEDVNGHSRYRHQDGNIAIAWNRKHDSPKGDLAVIYKAWPNPLQRVRGIGALIQSFQLDAITESQMEKFITNVSSRNKASQTGFRITANILSDSVLLRLEKQLEHEVKHMDEFSAVHLTATALPVGTLNESIGQLKVDLAGRHEIGSQPEKVNNAIAQLDKHAVNQFYIAPKQSRNLVNYLSRITGNEKIKQPNKVRMTPFISRDYEFIRHKLVAPMDYLPYVGTIGMLNQPGGKLRSVANINRFVNYTLDPYATALEKVFYSHPAVGVLNQKQALMDIQEWIRQGHTLTGMDLTAATDLLDYRVITEQFKSLGDETPILSAYAEYFEFISSMPLYVPGHGAISFETGQPLGTKGSFQTLTIMNLIAGITAAKIAGLDPNDSFRVVGDDFICKSELAPAYDAVIRSWAGKTNYDTAHSSNRHGEFLSHIVTRDSIHKMKPHYRPGYESLFINAEKSTVDRIVKYYKTDKQTRVLLEALAASGDHSISNSSDLRGSFRLPADDRQLIEKAKRLAASFSDGGINNTVEVPRIAIEMAHKERDVYSNESRETDRRKYITLPDGSKVFDQPARAGVHLDKGEFIDSVDKFDHKTNTRKSVKWSTGKLKRKQQFIDDRESARTNEKLVRSLSQPVPEKVSLGNGMSVNADSLLAAATLEDDAVVELAKQAVSESASAESRAQSLLDHVDDEFSSQLDTLGELATEKAKGPSL